MNIQVPLMRAPLRTEDSRAETCTVQSWRGAWGSELSVTKDWAQGPCVIESHSQQQAVAQDLRKGGKDTSGCDHGQHSRFVAEKSLLFDWSPLPGPQRHKELQNHQRNYTNLRTSHLHRL